MVGLVIFILAVAGLLAWLCAGGVDYMHKHHKDYKGEDFLNWKDGDSLKDDIS